MQQADREFLKTGKALLLVAFGLALGLVVAYIWPWPTVVIQAKNKDWVDIATALGTVGAVVVSLGLATAELRRRGQEGADRASLVAAQISPTLNDFVVRQTDFCVAMQFPTIPQGDLITVSRLVDWATTQRTFAVTSDQLIALSPLPNRCAFRLARGLSLFDLTLREIADEWGAYQGTLYCLGEDEVKKIRGMMAVPFSLLVIAARECERAASPVSAVPTPEELYARPAH
ncbi:hypothetical protein [Pandoraea commovens]|uniref:Uncharacterized protein n=1 Tax=Pandoraea commovens TaxID=2508289 RepID=A0A5E4SL08_9BURK|nr:hypothetical protein [Pandoraea commovens]VVD75094.1 hypothetical protein PCO31010_00833 [Pandoraea commovens]